MKQKTKEIISRLEKKYPNPKSMLNFSSVYELLVAVILSAQCTDARVNLVTKELFKVCNTPLQMVELGQNKLEKMIYSCGFYKDKAKHIIEMSSALIKSYGGEVPKEKEELVKLPGVGNKTANVVYSVGFGGDAIAVDTHVFRVSNRLGIVKAKNVGETEKQLNEAIDKEYWSRAHHYLIFLGREYCISRKPKCEICPLSDLCDYYKANGKKAKTEETKSDKKGKIKE